MLHKQNVVFFWRIKCAGNRLSFSLYPTDYVIMKRPSKLLNPISTTWCIYQMFRFDTMGAKLVYINMVSHSKWLMSSVYLLEVKRKWANEMQQTPFKSFPFMVGLTLHVPKWTLTYLKALTTDVMYATNYISGIGQRSTRLVW